MCRIVGFIDFNFNNSYSLEETITLMRDTLIYGGPDDAGVFIDKDFPVALGHRRLSILDLSPLGHQPMEFENLVITYNGEVYNFKEIKREFEKEGYKFISNSDAEVILKAFHRWGFSAVHKFRGMFAFALWDKKDKKLILCRDRIGVKPLYYYYKNGLFMFASELKAFHKHPKVEKS
jgi:asparagine synthase (glutamine-hydrolysing)